MGDSRVTPINDKNRLHPKISAASDGKASLHTYDNAAFDNAGKVWDGDDEHLAHIQSQPYDRVDYKRTRWKTTDNNDENYNHLEFTKSRNQFEVIEDNGAKPTKPIPAKRVGKHNTVTLLPTIATISVGVNQSERTKFNGEMDRMNTEEHGANRSRSDKPPVMENKTKSGISHVMGSETVMVENSDVYETLA